MSTSSILHAVRRRVVRGQRNEKERVMKRLWRCAITAGVLGGLLALPAGTAGARSDRCPLPGFGPGPAYRPVIDAREFSPEVDNAYFPLVPGRISIYTGTKDGKRAIDVVVPADRTRVVDGVRTRVVEDRLYLDGGLEERTADYYAQDRCGNVWYFGEDTAELDAHGKVVSRSGSFHAGEHGAQPGVFMEAKPTVGRQFRQEWSQGNAEDRYTTMDLHASVTVPAGTFHDALRTQERTDLEPGVVDGKYYARGIGEVVETSLAGPPERLVLVEIVEAGDGA
jgi:hypothetical protein